ncbi:MAG: hypothetical protein J4F28_08585 [Nitrosopumilaceae archaeon]|nr:hypothetical protein [Nitrosopumilaceae archaeon]
MSTWHHPTSYPVFDGPDDPLKKILGEMSDRRDTKSIKVVYLETRSSRLAAVFECDVNYTPRAWRRVRRAHCIGYLIRPASERRDTMRYACLLAEDNGSLRLEAAGSRDMVGELRRELAEVIRERKVYLRGGDNDYGPEAVYP